MGEPGMLRMLLQREAADLAATDCGGMTALHLAALSGSQAAVEELAQAGADVNVPAGEGPLSGMTPLMLAASKGQENALQALLSLSATDIEARDSHGLTALLHAAEAGAVTSVAALAAAGAELEAADSCGQRALHLAVAGGHLACVHELLLAEAEMEAASQEYGFTPLMLAAVRGQEACLRTLVAAGASVEARDSNGCAVLELAAHNGQLSCLLALVEEGASLDAAGQALSWAAQRGHVACVQALLCFGAPSPDELNLALLHAIHRGHTACVEELLEAGAPTGGQGDLEGYTPLGLAAAEGRPEAVRLLLVYGASPDARDPESGYTPLLLAVKNRRAECVAALLAGGCDASASVPAPGDGRTALHLAAALGSESCLLLLLQHGADTEARTRAGMTAAMSAVQGGQAACLAALLQAGASTAAATEQGLTPLMLAVMRDDEACLHVLLGHNCALEAADEQGRTALHLAAAGGHLACALALLEKGASHSACNEWDEQPLHLAAAHGHPDLIQLLVEGHGADIDAEMEGGLTPLDLARRRQQWAAEEALQKLGARRTGQQHKGHRRADEARHRLQRRLAKQQPEEAGQQPAAQPKMEQPATPAGPAGPAEDAAAAAEAAAQALLAEEEERQQQAAAKAAAKAAKKQRQKQRKQKAQPEGQQRSGGGAEEQEEGEQLEGQQGGEAEAAEEPAEDEEGGAGPEVPAADGEAEPAAAEELAAGEAAQAAEAEEGSEAGEVSEPAAAGLQPAEELAAQEAGQAAEHEEAAAVVASVAAAAAEPAIPQQGGRAEEEAAAPDGARPDSPTAGVRKKGRRGAPKHAAAPTAFTSAPAAAAAEAAAEDGGAGFSQVSRGRKGRGRGKGRQQAEAARAASSERGRGGSLSRGGSELGWGASEELPGYSPAMLTPDASEAPAAVPAGDSQQEEIEAAGLLGRLQLGGPEAAGAGAEAAAGGGAEDGEDELDSMMQLMGLPASGSSSSDWGSASIPPAAPPFAAATARCWATQAGSGGSGACSQAATPSRLWPSSSSRPASSPPSGGSRWASAAAAPAAPAAEPGADAPLGFTGLRNEAGEYNCFLNVIVQCLWRCAEFRRMVLAWDDSVTSSSPVAAALRSLFRSLAAAAERQHGAGGAGGAPVALNPAVLREALASLPGQQFQLGEMSDAGETLLAMYESIREAHPAAGAALDALFGLRVREEVVCRDPACRKVTHDHEYTQHFFNTRATALRGAVAQAAEERRLGRLGPKTLGARLHKVEGTVHKSCDTDKGGCNKTWPVTVQLEAAPRVFSLQIAWESNRASPAEVGGTLAALDETISLPELYPGFPTRGPPYALRSMVCYYGQHYQALVLVPEAGGWLMFDDARVTRVGSWADVRRKCEAGRIQPSRATLLSVDEALTACKEFGPAQRLQLLVVGIAWALGALQTLAAVVFSTLSPPPPECVKPDDEACTQALAAGQLCSLPREAWHWPSTGGSLVAEFDLVCSRHWVVYLQTSAFFIAVLIGCVLWQAGSERYGRRRLLVGGAALCGLSSMLASTAPSLWMYLAFRCASGLGVGGMGVAAYALAADLAGPTWRSFTGLLINCFFSVGCCLATLLAWWVPGWRALAFIGGLACLGYTGAWSLIIESPSWLLLKARKGEATAALAAVALANGCRPPEHPLADPTALLGNTQRGLRDVLASSRLRRRLVLLAAAWFAAGAGYFGLMLLADGMSSGGSSGGSGGGTAGKGGSTAGDDSVYINLLSGFAYEVPGIAAAGLAVERAGRKATGVAAFMQAGVCLVVSAVVGGTARRALVVAARFGLAAACATLFLHTAELFPAVVREQGLGAANACGRAGAALTPLFAFLQQQLRRSFVPLLVMGSLCLGAAVLSLGLPETLNEPYPETIQEMNIMEQMKRKRSWRLALAGWTVPSAGAGSALRPSSSSSSSSTAFASLPPLSVLVLVGATITTLAGSFIAFMLYLRPVLAAAERAASAAERAAQEMETAAQEMEKAAKMMQEDMPLTFQDMQRTSKEFEILGKQLNYLTGVVVKPVKEPVQWVGKAAETTSSTVSTVSDTVQSVTTTSIRKVVNEIKTLANALNPTISQVRERLGLEFSSSADGKKLPAPLAAGSNGSAPVSRAAAVAAQAEAAAREVGVSRRQADAQQWIAAWRSRTRGNKKAAAAVAAHQASSNGEIDRQRLEQVGQMLADGVMQAEHEAAAAAVFAALERAQRAAEEAASASGALEAAIKQAENNGALPSMDEDDSSNGALPSMDEDDSS
ncbi:ankyrin repeat [Chlorella sorokiniana]|uniref:Ankyrin repeat n=1 Tax=Chlorella sorokiniana TaxID=3076 RepID=A0A2P6TRH3_CHLSO|nr:ankyrin repeat [Chlorella sorokiniana]|eukprot:PRW56655.1 ankyrin repeat [Chlorella sorokiniana]